MLKAAFKNQRGFTLIELLAVMAILGILAAMVSTAVIGVGEKGHQARLSGDQDTIGKSADRFFTDSFPQTYPVADPDSNGDALLNANDMPPLPAGDVGVKVIEFDSALPQDATRSFVPDFIKEVPDSAALISWRINTATGNVFFTEPGAALVNPSSARLDVSATDRTIATASDHLLNGTMKKNEAAVELLVIDIPAGYTMGGQSLPAGQVLGTLEGSFAADNPWDAGYTISFFGILETTGSANRWQLEVDYDVDGAANQYMVNKVNVSTSGNTSGMVGTQRSNRTHAVSIAPPTESAPGRITITMDRADDPAHHEASETWKLTLYDFAQRRSVINGVPTASYEDMAPQVLVVKNPNEAVVARWLAKEHTTIDVEGVFDEVAGNQAVNIQTTVASN